MAKIGNLEVGKIKIEEAAITVLGTAVSSLVVNNTYGAPSQIYMKAVGSWSSVAKASGSSTANFRRNGTLLRTMTQSWSGNTGGAQQIAAFNFTYLDLNPSGSITYDITTSSTSTDTMVGNAFCSAVYVVCIYEKV